MVSMACPGASEYALGAVLFCSDSKHHIQSSGQVLFPLWKSLLHCDNLHLLGGWLLGQVKLLPTVLALVVVQVCPTPASQRL